MNYKSFVGFGFYGAASVTSMANLYSSWGLRSSLSTPALVSHVRDFIHHILPKMIKEFFKFHTK
jgi:hypothetical protein